MNLTAVFSPETMEKPFESYGEYTDYLFSCVDLQLSSHIRSLMDLFAREDGSFRNILYPDIDSAYSLCEKHLADFSARTAPKAPESAPEGISALEEDSDLMELFAGFAQAEPESAAVPAQMPQERITVG